MKKYKFFALAFAAMTLAACSSDDVVDDGGKGSAVAPGETGYVSLAINLPSQQGGTRIDEVYDAGTTNENNVKSAYLLLFSGASEAAATFQSAYELSLGTWTGQTGNVSSTTKVVQQITRPVSGNLYALVVLNGGGGTGDAIEEGTSATEGWKFGGNALTANSTAFSLLYSTALTLPLADVTGTTDGFLMTNAPLYSKQGGSNNPSGGAVQTLAPVDVDNIYSSQADAQTGEPAADVYVERAVAKVSVTAQGTEGGSGLIPYTLSGYALDVTNNKTFLVRNVANAPWWGYKSTDVSVKGENQYRFVGSDAVATNLYRTYWGIDPNYTSAPSGDLTIGTGVPALTNTPLYCFENTFNVDNMRQNVTTHVVIGAKLTITGQDGTSSDFYTIGGDKDVIYDGIDDVKGKVLEAYLNNTTIADAINKGKVTTATVDASDFDVTFDSKASTDGGYLTVSAITVKEGSESDFTEGNVPTELVNNSAIVSAISNSLNIAYYKGGVSYYPVMIKHFGNGETPWAADPSQTESYPATNRDQNYLGRYGVLRNNSYQITVNNVKKIGYPEVPTYPGSYDDPVESWIGVTINILPWVVRSQDVSLGE